MPDKGGVADALDAATCADLGVEVLRSTPRRMRKTLTESLKNWLAAGSVQGVYWLPALDDEGDLGEWICPRGMKPCGCASNRFTSTMRTLYEQIAQRRARSWSRPRGWADSMATTKPELSRRWAARSSASPRRTSASGRTPSSKRSISKPNAIRRRSPSLLIEETLRDPGAVEIGYKDGLRWTVGLQEQPAADGQPGLTLDREHASS